MRVQIAKDLPRRKRRQPEAFTAALFRCLRRRNRGDLNKFVAFGGFETDLIDD